MQDEKNFRIWNQDIVSRAHMYHMDFVLVKMYVSASEKDICVFNKMQTLFYDVFKNHIMTDKTEVCNLSVYMNPHLMRKVFIVS
jgi:hypothetical protein